MCVCLCLCMGVHMFCGCVRERDLKLQSIYKENSSYKEFSLSLTLRIENCQDDQSCNQKEHLK